MFHSRIQLMLGVYSHGRNWRELSNLMLHWTAFFLFTVPIVLLNINVQTTFQDLAVVVLRCSQPSREIRIC